MPLTAPGERAEARAVFPEERGGTPLGPGLCTNTKQKPDRNLPQLKGSVWLPCRGGAGKQRKPGSKALLKTEACPGEQRLRSIALHNRKQQSTSRRDKRVERGPFGAAGIAKS